MECIQKEDGFTLIEMMIVLLIISVLILIAIPNVTKHSQSIDKKGCEAYQKMVQGQVEAYKMDEKAIPQMQDLITKGYLSQKGATCPNGSALSIDSEGKVSGPLSTSTPSGG